jgi:hypothetical protein
MASRYGQAQLEEVVEMFQQLKEQVKDQKEKHCR